MSTEHGDRRLSRRSFLINSLINFPLLAASTSCMTSSCDRLTQDKKRSFTGKIMGGNVNAGHMLLESDRTEPSIKEKTGIVIVGGGIAGLSAARELIKKKYSDFLLLELEEEAGGNSISGANNVSPYPWGAHYVPIPGKDAVFVSELFEELGIIERYDGNGLPVYNEYYLCADPQERLFIHGRWQEGLIPQTGMTGRDKQQYERFFSAMENFKKATGADGKKAFSIPVDYSSKDNRFLRLDSISMSEYLSENGWDSEYLRWYVNYCCRDDYGCVMEDVSAWAGIHYFAARTGIASNADSHAVVTWPEGNGWIVKRMSEKFSSNVRQNSCVLNIENAVDQVAVDYYDTRQKVFVRVLSKAVIYAAPRFTAFKTVREFRQQAPSYADIFGYSPWMIANITVRQVPEGKGASLSWDNVSFHSNSLGYVVATHQDIALRRDRTVLTYYMPLTSGDPQEERKKALARTYEDWADMISKDLSGMHPGIADIIEELNVWVWGHAMIRPVPVLIWGKARQEAMKPIGRIHFANSDMSGLSLFEEAQYRGIMAARQLIQGLK